MKVCVIGLGVVGLPTALYVAGKGLRVVGYDISPAAVERARSKGIEVYLDWGRVGECDAYIVCVNTLLRGEEPDLSPVFDVAGKVAAGAPEGALLSVESTVTPGTCRRIYNEVVKRKLKVVHVPHRYWAGDPVRYGVRQLRVIGAVDEGSLEAGLKLYRDVLDIPLHVTPSVEVAEMSKVLENAYRYVQIAFAEEARMMCEYLGLDFETVREACNTKWNIEILEARDGIGGHCLPKDVRYAISLTPYNHLMSAAVRVDESYREWLARRRRSS